MRGECIRTKKEKYKEYLGLYKKYSNNLIKSKLKINDSLLLEFLTKAIKESITEAEDQKIFNEKIPFSEDEMDYGERIIVWSKKYKNSPIKKPELTELQIAIKSYKIQFKNK